MIAACARSVTPVPIDVDRRDSGTPVEFSDARDTERDTAFDTPRGVPCFVARPPLDGGNMFAVQIVVGPQRPFLAGEGFSVRVDRGATSLETVTNADGVALLPISPSDGSFDVTVARIGYIAVSILDVSGPLRDPILSMPYGPPALAPSCVRSRHVRGTLRGVANTTDPITVVAFAGTSSSDPAFDILFDPTAAPTALHVFGIEYARDGRAAQNGVHTVIAPAPLDDIALDLFLPATPAPRQQGAIAIRVGQLMGGFLGDLRGEAERLDPSVVTNVVPVGTTSFQWMPSGNGRLTFDALAGDLSPDRLSAWGPICGGDPNPCSLGGLGTVAIRAPSDSTSVDVPDIATLQCAGGQTLASARLTVDAPAYDDAGFLVRTYCTPFARAGAPWIGFSYSGAAIATRMPPALPSRIGARRLLSSLQGCIVPFVERRADPGIAAWGQSIDDARIVVTATGSAVTW